MRAGVQRAVGAALAGGLVAALLAGCTSGAGTGESAGGTVASATTGADTAAVCRTRWAGLQQVLRGRDGSEHPSDLAERWTPVIATAAHYAASATAADCAPGTGALDQARASIAQVERFSAQLREFDVPYRMSVLAPAATDYLLGTRSSPASSPGSSPRDDSRPRPPSRASVRRALTVLQEQGPAAVRDMADGWAEAASVDLGDEAAVRRTLADLRFLAGDSTPFQACLPALAVLEEAAAARG